MTTPTPPRLHPLLTIAAVSVTAVSLAGIGVLTGILPSPSKAATDPAPVVATSPAATQATPQAAQAAGAPTPEAAPVSAASQKHLAHRAINAMADKRPATAKKTATPPVGTPVPPADSAPAPVVAAPALCNDCGVVEAIHEVTQDGKATGVGAVAGAVVGGIIGNQIGSGSSRGLARTIGMIGGGIAGHQIEKTQRKSVHYDVVVRMEDGSSRTVSTGTQPEWHTGDRVRITDGVLVANR